MAKPTYKIGEFKASSNPENVVTLLVEEDHVQRAERHHSFIRWFDVAEVSDAVSALEQLMEAHRWNSTRMVPAAVHGKLHEIRAMLTDVPYASNWGN